MKAGRARMLTMPPVKCIILGGNPVGTGRLSTARVPIMAIQLHAEPMVLGMRAASLEYANVSTKYRTMHTC
jgi:hypothetical protein